ncbi:hydrolase [Acinetobacter gyllenbergii]|uniref:Pimelyl-[acyl-carrier protein] methyl esterase n=1 Tax=Acinetobacter gyllenbergii CIP 110306 = MTCC 11365 TaxID=1217657 RepID=A0A829HF53_9GAMM|nr:biotin synthesis protein bioH [Acinetobacter gyllenbergii]EPF77437.1 pimelyl-[acyl-carrier protein] methyl esterase [Acinetobacter gyllenbergii CIP 110306 = MTCC 11365]EPH33394.1 Biotin synthesis protein bioH [Acinetobacter gyllenbergii CIP 110306 = MTCC 11365]GMA11265.1 hydrolase [Acinetobacter gyllenbergii]
MTYKILLITGWGGGAELLKPLHEALEQKGHIVERLNIFNALNDDILQQQVELAVKFDVIVGWSLGGQLATLLVDQIQQQYTEQKVLITLASNPCFVAQADWTTAMPVETFIQFKQSFEQDAITTLKRFGLLVCQGASSAKNDFVVMQKLIRPQPIALLRQGLKLLEQLNLVELYEKYQGRQLHVFAEHDALVPYQVVQKTKDLAAKNLSVVSIDGASHGFPCFMVEQTAQIIEDFIQ